MKLIHRFAFFGGGFTLGIFILIFILNGKKTSCSYGPESRTLKNIRSKKRDFSENALMVFEKNKLDTALVGTLLTDGDVLFSESNTDLDSCKQYVIEGKISEKNLKIKVANCDKTATVFEVEME